MLAKDSQDAAVGARLHGTLAVQTALILKGAHILRTHDVKESVEAARVTDVVLSPR
jgi:dihydropteroate synthase